MRRALLGAMLAAYMLYAAVRILGLGDAATYDSTAFFLYAALFCVALFAIQPGSPLLGWIGSGSYFIYLWHIFIVMALRDHTSLHQLGGIASFAVCCGLTVLLSTAALLAVRQLGLPATLPLAGGLSDAPETHPALSARAIRRTAVPASGDDRMDACRRRTHARRHHADHGHARIAADRLSRLVVAICAALPRTLPGRQRRAALLPHRKCGPAGIHCAAERGRHRNSASGHRARRQNGPSPRRRRLCDDPIPQPLYRRARPRAAADPGLHDPAGIRAVGRIYRRPGVDQIVRPIGGVAACGIRRGATDRGADRAARDSAVATAFGRSTGRSSCTRCATAFR